MKDEAPNDPDRQPFQFPERVLPAGFRPREDEEEAHDEEEGQARVPLEVLCTVDEPGLEGVCRRLDAEGIPSEVREATPTTRPLSPEEPGRWNVLVRTIDLQAAREALTRPDLPTQAEDDDFDDQFYIIRGTCPKCRHPHLEQVPLTPGWRTIRRVCFGLILVPILVLILINLALPAEDFRPISNVVSSWACTWVAVCVVLFVVGLGPTRKKICPECGWQPTGDKSGPATGGSTGT